MPLLVDGLQLELFLLRPNKEIFKVQNLEFLAALVVDTVAVSRGRLLTVVLLLMLLQSTDDVLLENVPDESLRVA